MPRFIYSFLLHALICKLVCVCIESSCSEALPRILNPMCCFVGGTDARRIMIYDTSCCQKLLNCILRLSEIK